MLVCHVYKRVLTGEKYIQADKNVTIRLRLITRTYGLNIKPFSQPADSYLTEHSRDEDMAVTINHVWCNLVIVSRCFNGVSNFHSYLKTVKSEFVRIENFIVFR